MDIAFVNMPFGGQNRPSIALTQLTAVVADTFGDRVQASIHHANHAFCAWIGEELYSQVALGDYYTVGLGDWLFREAAFPELEPNHERYFRRYFPGRGRQELRDRILEVKSAVVERCEILIDEYNLAERDLVGFTTMFSQTVPSIALARMIRQWNPEVRIVIGGANCEGSMGRVLVEKFDVFDAVFSGPALVSFPDYIRHFVDGTGRGPDEIAGVFTRKNRTGVDGACGGELLSVRTGTSPPEVAPFGADLPIDRPIPLDYDSFLDSFDRHLGGSTTKPRLFFETARGCWWGERTQCTFSGLNGSTMDFRSKSAEVAVEEINRLLHQYADRCQDFRCVDNIIATSYFTEVLPHLDVPDGVSLYYEVKANLSDAEVKQLADASVLRIQPGVEALSTPVLRLMRKGSNSFTNVRFLKSCERWGVEPAWNLLIGFPGEDPAVYDFYLERLPRLYHLPPPTGAFPLRFDRFSPYFDEADEFGLRLQPYDFYRLTFPLLKDDLFDLAYFFADQNFDAPYLTNFVGHMEPLQQQVTAWQKAWATGSAPSLRLVEVNGSPAILDSRDRDEKVTLTTDSTVAVLTELERPRSRRGLRVPRLDGVDVERALSFADGNDLLFDENNHILNLVQLPGPGRSSERSGV